ncbi:MAG: hypothetical protein IIC78_05275 [Chloroflexi bacterium]|nr:hypothetical protein [Chloroflexota bacterium]
MALGNPERAALLLGASKALLEEIGVSLWPANRLEYERDLASTQALLEEKTLVRLIAEGEHMTEEEALTYAFEDRER